jgi:superfamily II DNA or RNA helicase
MMNFKKFTLPEVIRGEGEDPCNEKIVNELTLYQRFVGQFVSYKSPFKDILIYHGLGAGKTVSAVNIYNVLYNYTPKWNVFLLIKASLKNDPWLKDLKNWLKKHEEMMKNIKFISYDAPNADEQFIEATKKSDAANNNLFIVDEAHNFIRNVYGNKTSKQGKRAQVIYDAIIQEKKETGNARVILLSATPAINQPFELALLFNLLRPGSFPDSEALFNQLYISSSGYRTLNEETKNMFQRRILGLVSYYIGATPDKFAEKTVHYRDITMNKYYEQVYSYFEEIEEKKEQLRLKMSRGKVGEDEMSTYKTYTRQASNFVFPSISEKIFGEKRPRPGDYRVKETDEAKVVEGKEKEQLQEMRKDKREIVEYEMAAQKYLDAFTDYCLKIHEQDKKLNHTILDDMKDYLGKYQGKIGEFLNAKKHSKLFEKLNECSPKMIMIILYTLKSKGPVLVYTNYVRMEGIEIFKIYCKFIGFINVVKDQQLKEKKHDFFRYMEFHGGIDREIREQNRNIFNNPDNKNGKSIKIFMVSPAGTEGINLENVRQVHVMEPYWNEVRIEQVIGRAIRQCSHKSLPMNERKVDVYRYKMVRNNQKETTDQLMEDIAQRKNNLIQSFLEAVRESAVDCQLFKNHNMMGLEYQCFNFNQDALLEKPVGPAFKEDEEFDAKINNGSNSADAITKRIKVKKIKVVNQLDENNFSEVLTVWYHPETHYVYDLELHYPLGKVKLNEEGLPVQIEKDVYLVSDVIKIPSFQYFE